MERRNDNNSVKRSSENSGAWHAPVALLLIFILVAGAVAISKMRKPASPQTVCYTSVDVSASNESRLDSEFTLLEHAVDLELPADIPLTIWAFSNYKIARKVYSTTPKDSMALWELEKAITKMITRKDTETYPQVAIKAMADSAETTSADRVVCLLLWDGEICGDIRDFSRQIKRLANNPKVTAVVCIGLISDKGIRSYAEKAMQCLGNRLIVCGPHDRSEITRLRELLKHQIQVAYTKSDLITAQRSKRRRL